MSTEIKNAASVDTPIIYTAKDFASDQDVRWCPGCGDYSILAQIQRTMPTLGYRKEDLVFVAGTTASGPDGEAPGPLRRSVK